MSWETSRKIEEELQLGENSHLELYTYLKENYKDVEYVYDFPKGEKVSAFYLSDDKFLPIIEKFNLPVEIRLNKNNDKFSEEILWCTYIGFYHEKI